MKNAQKWWTKEAQDFVSNAVFFSTKKYAFYLKKKENLCLFLKNVAPSKRAISFILNNSHLSLHFMPCLNRECW